LPVLFSAARWFCFKTAALAARDCPDERPASFLDDDPPRDFKLLCCDSMPTSRGIVYGCALAHFARAGHLCGMAPEHFCLVSSKDVSGGDTTTDVEPTGCWSCKPSVLHGVPALVRCDVRGADEGGRQ
jgi:hypothetical protein